MKIQQWDRNLKIRLFVEVLLNILSPQQNVFTICSFGKGREKADGSILFLNE